MKRTVMLLAAASLAAALVLPGPAAAGGRRVPAALGPPRVVATFPTGYEFNSFAESLAVDSHGVMFATVTIWQAETWNRGQLWRIAPDGTMTKLGPDLDVGMLTGLAFDDQGWLYAGLVTFDIEGVTSGVLRFAPDGTATRVITLPAGTLPNGLAFRDGNLYISDSWNGAVWRARPRTGSTVTLTTPWLQDASLAPVTGWEGVNGIAFRGNALYAVNADTAAVVRIPLLRAGRAGTPQVMASDPALVGADGVAFDEDGGLWATVNHGDKDVGGALVRVARDGTVRVLADDPGWLDYPSQAAFGTTAGRRSTLYVLNGSLNTGNCNLIALPVGVRGLRLP